MKITSAKLLLILLIALFHYGCKEKKEEADDLQIAVASNLQYAIKSLTEEFEKKSGIHCDVILGSSGKLYAQISEGAPYDLFLSADMDYPEALYQQGHSPEPPRVFANGSLVLWSAKPGVNPSISVLDKDSIRHIAIANPKIAPYGKAALQVLEHYALTEKLSDKLVYGESIAQANQFIRSGAAEIGFTSLAVVRNPLLSQPGRYILIDSLAHEPLPHGVVLIKDKNGIKASAKTFYEYLFSGDGKAILKKFGYSVHE